MSSDARSHARAPIRQIGDFEKRSGLMRGALSATWVLAILAGAPSLSQAASPTLTAVASFNGTDGANPVAGLIADANGNLFGTTIYGGASNSGTVFEITKTADGYASAPTILISFNGSDGAYPRGGLTADANGNLFGTTNGGGAYGYGTAFEITKTARGYAGTPITLVSFNGSDGMYPEVGPLIADAHGNFFGTTNGGGAYGYGTVFEIVKTASGYASTPTTLANFNGTDGANPFAGLLADADGNLFGTTDFGGPDRGGTVFEIAKTASGYASTPITLASFNNDANPLAGLIADTNGNLFGTTNQGGGPAPGTVFEITKTASGYASTPITLATFNGTDGANPFAGLLADADGNLFGTTYGGIGASEYGTVFEIAKTAGGYATTPITVVSFDVTNGANPWAGLIADGKGNLFGTTFLGGNTSCSTAGSVVVGCGTVFEITGSGFVVPITFAGMPGKPNCHGQSVSALAKQYGGLDAAAAALGYSSVQVLQNAVAVYCAG